MNKPTDAQIKELWEWCGVEPMLRDFTVSGGYITEPRLIYPDLDLNNLFKYAVPKLQDKGHNINITAFECKGFRVDVSDNVYKQDAMSGYDPYRSTIAMAENEVPALALFWAIWEVVKK